MADEPISRRRLLRRAGATGLGAVGIGTAASGLGAASPSIVGANPEDAPDDFAGDAPTCDRGRTDDTALPFDTDGNYGGWGGHEYHGTDSGGNRTPVVFVHGNTDDACAFDPHTETFLDRGYGGDRLWSITFRDATSTHAEMRDQLEAFVENVLEYTDEETIDVVAHSLGVTGARFWMAEEDRYNTVDTFIGLAGANHGTWVCGPGCRSLPGKGEECDFVSLACAEPEGPLWELNTPDETPGDVDYYTIRGGLDVFFLHDRESPALEGAENVLFEWAGHNATRESDGAIRLVYEWLDGE